MGPTHAAADRVGRIVDRPRILRDDFAIHSYHTKWEQRERHKLALDRRTFLVCFLDLEPQLARRRSLPMGKQPITPPTPEPAEPRKHPQPDPPPYEDPVKEPPHDPPEERPLIDPVPPDRDTPRM